MLYVFQVYTRTIVKSIKFGSNYAVCWTLKTISTCFCWTLRSNGTLFCWTEKSNKNTCYQFLESNKNIFYFFLYSQKHVLIVLIVMIAMIYLFMYCVCTQPWVQVLCSLFHICCCMCTCFVPNDILSIIDKFCQHCPRYHVSVWLLDSGECSSESRVSTS